MIFFYNAVGQGLFILRVHDRIQTRDTR